MSPSNIINHRASYDLYTEGIILFKSVNQHFNKNKQKYFFLFLALVVGIISGILLVSAVKPEDTTKLTETIKTSLTTIDTKAKVNLFFDYLWKNTKSVLFILVGTYSVYLLPLLFLNLIITGFSLGFTTTFITSYFGFKGFLVSMLMYCTDLLLCIPLTLALSTVAIDYTLHNSKVKSMLKITNRKKFAIICICFLALLTIISIPNVFIFPYFVKSFVA